MKFIKFCKHCKCMIINPSKHRCIRPWYILHNCPTLIQVFAKTAEEAAAKYTLEYYKKENHTMFAGCETRVTVYSRPQGDKGVDIIIVGELTPTFTATSILKPD